MRGPLLPFTALVTLSLSGRAAGANEAAMTMGVLAEGKQRMALLFADLAAAPAEFARLGNQIANTLASGAGVRAAAYLLILMIVGIGAEWLFWTYAWSPLQAIRTTRVTSPRQAFGLAMRRLGFGGSGLLLFALTVLGASTLFSWPAGVLELLIAAVLATVLLRLTGLLTGLILLPRQPGAMLVDLPRESGSWIAALVMVLALLFAAGRFVPELIEGDAPHAARTVQFACGSLAALILLAAALRTYGLRPAPAARAASGRRLPAVPRSLWLVILVLVIYSLWLLSGSSPAQVVAILAVVVMLEMHLHGLVFFFWRDEMAKAAPAQVLARGEPAQMIPVLDPSLGPNVVLAAARLATVLLGLAACALALGVPVMALAMSEHPLVRFAIRVLGVAALALLTNVVWIIIKSAIDHRLRIIGPVDPHAEPGPNARLLTLLPLSRVAAAVFLGSMFVLSALWALGIEITPLLAGAGVIGIALGFGAQALVRDIIAGIFLLVEDVFRVGEYIESGTSTKGTVERITLRTVALRHHNGPLHFVPFGALGVVRNNSRDWVVEKFNLPLPISADSEKVRKMIKRIGQEMLDDPELAPLIHEPLKGKLYRVDPGVKIFRCAFQTAPGNQFDVRAAAYKRIEAGMKDLGLTFADGRQVLVQAAEAPK